MIMNPTIKIENAMVSKVDIATYTQFQQEMYRMTTLFSGDTYEAFRISAELLAVWDEKIKVLVDVNKVIRATVNTEKLAEIDELRDKMISRFFGSIKFGLDSFESDEVEASKRLELVRKKYSGIQKLNYDRQTASVDGLLQDLSSDQTKLDIAVLGMSGMVEKIAETNNNFRQLYGEVSDTRATTKLPTFNQLRSELSPLWDEVVQRIQAGYIFAKNDAERKKIAELVDGLNQRIKQIKDAFSRSQGIKKSASKKKEAEKADVE